MERAITWYEILGVLPGAEPDKIKRKYDERASLLRAEITYPTGSGSGSDLGVVGEIAGDLGGDVLGGLLPLGGFLGPSPRPANRVPVPDLRGLFYDVSLEVAGRLGLKVRSVQLTPHPMPVDGLVVDQVPRPPGKLRRDETLMAHVWHPPIRPGR